MKEIFSPQAMTNYPAICRHFQFSDLSNGTWYIEILATADLAQFITQEVRNGEVKRRSPPMTFAECRKVFWARTVNMSREAGNESLPPPQIRIDWK